MHRHRRPGWRRRRLLSDIEAMHRQSAQIVRTELLAPGFVKQHRTAPRACSRWQAGSASDDAGYAANRRSGSLILLAYLAPRYSVAEVGCNVSDVVRGPSRHRSLRWEPNADQSTGGDSVPEAYSLAAWRMAASASSGSIGPSWQKVLPMRHDCGIGAVPGACNFREHRRRGARIIAPSATKEPVRRGPSSTAIPSVRSLLSNSFSWVLSSSTWGRTRWGPWRAGGCADPIARNRRG